MKQTPFGSVKFIHGLSGLLALEALIAEILPDMRPVFAFDVGVVVFVIGS